MSVPLSYREGCYGTKTRFIGTPEISTDSLDLDVLQLAGDFIHIVTRRSISFFPSLGFLSFFFFSFFSFSFLLSFQRLHKPRQILERLSGLLEELDVFRVGVQIGHAFAEGLVGGLEGQVRVVDDAQQEVGDAD